MIANFAKQSSPSAAREIVDIKDDALILNVHRFEKVTVRPPSSSSDVIGKDNAPKEKEEPGPGVAPRSSYLLLTQAPSPRSGPASLMPKEIIW